MSKVILIIKIYYIIIIILQALMKKIILLIMLSYGLCVYSYQCFGMKAPYNNSKKRTADDAFDQKEIPLIIASEDDKTLTDSEAETDENKNSKPHRVICDYPQCGANISSNSIRKHLYAIHGEGAQLVTCDEKDCGVQIARYLLKKHISNAHKEGSKLVFCDVPECTAQVLHYCLPAHKYNSHSSRSEKIMCDQPGCMARFLPASKRKHLKNTHSPLIECLECKQKIKDGSIGKHLKIHEIAQLFYLCNHCKEESNDHIGFFRHLKKAHLLSSPFASHYTKQIHNPKFS